MSDIKELEQRLSAALTRIGAALSTPAAPVDDGRLAEAEAALEAERAQSAELQARIAELHEQLENADAHVRDLTEELTTRDALTQQLRRVNEQLRSNNAALREANGQGATDPHLINKSMLAELESIRASRDADRAEVDAALAALAPLLKEAADA